MKLLKAFAVACGFTFFLGLWIGFTTYEAPAPLVSGATNPAPICDDEPMRKAKKVCQ